MDVFIPNLHENRPGFVQKVTRHRKPIAQIGQVRVDAIFLCITKRFDLLRLAANLINLSILDIPRSCGDLPIRVEPDSIGRTEVNALNLPAQSLLLRKTCHHLQAVTKNKPVRPVLIVRVELQLGLMIRQSIEVVEKAKSRLPRLLAGAASSTVSAAPQ